MKAFAPEAEFIIFGSRARGDNRNDSDVDLLVLLPDSLDGTDFVKRQSEISEKLYDISLNNLIDIIPIITVKKIFYQRITPFTINVKNEGIIL